MVGVDNERFALDTRMFDLHKDVGVGLAFFGIDHDRDMLMADLFGNVEGRQPIGLNGLSAGHPLLKYGLDVLAVDFY